MEEVLFLCRTPGGIGHGRGSASSMPHHYEVYCLVPMR